MAFIKLSKSISAPPIKIALPAIRLEEVNALCGLPVSEDDE